MTCHNDSQKTRLNIDAWSASNPSIGSGHDPRSSENGLLAIFAGSVERASQAKWLDPKRPLINKTYLHILWQVVPLPPIEQMPHTLAIQLDAFIHKTLLPLWTQLEFLGHEHKHNLAVQLVDDIARNALKNSDHDHIASWLLYYLCPQLPVFPIPTLDKRLQPSLSYAQHHSSTRLKLIRTLPFIQGSTPSAVYGDKSEKDFINRIILASDWWQRHILLHNLSPQKL